MDLPKLLNTIRDPAVFSACVLIAIYLNRNYTKKESHDSLKKSVDSLRTQMKSEIDEIHKDYVSKEKLSDVMKPVTDQLDNIGREIGEIKTFMMEVFKKYGGN